MPAPRLIFHLIPHTHWDREWYLPRGQFGARLVAMVDDLIDLLQADPSIPGFLLDGQTVLLEDYLRVRPAQEEMVKELVSAGRIETGPWYVLADEQIPSGESLVRNLLLGKADGERLGRRLDVLYSPDSFGHPAIWPTLAREFGIDVGVAWRGINDSASAQPPARPADLLLWLGPDGARIVLYHLPPGGYEIGSGLSSDPERVGETWAAVRGELVPRATGRHVAVFIGADHHAARSDLSTLRELIARLEPEHEVRLSRLSDFTESVREASGLSSIAGEQRYHGYTWTLQGVHGTRAHQKRRNGQLELWLERYAEPLAALAGWRGGRDRRPLLTHAWRSLVQCHFHDSIGGCVSDDVAREVETRFIDVEGVAREVVRGSLQDLWGLDPDRARDQPEAVKPSLLLWNPAVRNRGGMVLASITMFRRDVRVGPPGGRQPKSGGGFQPFLLQTKAGETIPFQVLDVVPALERLDAARHYPDQDEVDLIRVAFQAPSLPGLESATLNLVPSDSGPRLEPAGSSAGRSLKNDLVEIRIERDLSLTLTNRLSGRVYRGLLRVEHEADLGDTYTFCAPAEPGPTLRTGRATIRRLCTGPLVSALEASWSLTPIADPRRLSDGRIDVNLTVMLLAGEPVARCTVQIMNRGTDQRLRARFSTGVAGIAALAGTQFGMIARPPSRQPTTHDPLETPAPTAPAHGFLAAADTHGLGIFSPGFFEYELTSGGDVLLTLLRSVGQLSKDDLSTRPGHAGWPIATPLAQCLGTHSIQVGLAPLAGRICHDGAMLHRMWEDVFVPVRGTWIRDCIPLDDTPAERATIELEGDGLVLSAIKPAALGSPGIVLRCYNLRDEPVAGRWRLGFPVHRVEQCRADETVMAELPVEDGGRVIRFLAAARQIVTIVVYPW